MNKCQILLLLISVSSPAYSHVPYVEGLDFTDSEAYSIQAPIEKSLAIYLSFDAKDDIDQAQFTLTEADLDEKNSSIAIGEAGEKGRKAVFNTIVPSCAPYANILPQVALVGPIQEKLVKLSPDIALPFTLEEGQGVYLLGNDQQGEVFKENFSGTSYWQQQKAEFILTKPGDYRIFVWEAQGQIGDYVLVFGDKEIFGPQEIVQAGKRINFLRQGLEIKNEQCRKAAKS